MFAALRQTKIIISLDDARARFLQMVPGLISWSALILLSSLALILPFWISIFVIAYDVYVLIRVIYMSVHLLYAYRRLKANRGIDWLSRCQGVSGNIKEYREHLQQLMEKKQALGATHSLAYEQLGNHLTHVEQLSRSRQTIVPWRQVHHVVIVPTYNESLTVLRTSIKSLAATDFPKDRMHVVVGFEERAGEAAKTRAAALQAEFGSAFASFLTTFHPADLPGEKKVKSANATWAMQQMEKVLAEKQVKTDDVLVSNFDSDTVVAPDYFSYLTYTFITHPDRYHVSYQPLPLYNNNVWDAPSFSRVVATSSTFWQLIESTRPERLVTFSSHSMTLKALKDVGYWQKDIISEDSRIFWQCLLHYDGHYHAEPLYTTVSMDAALAETWWMTLVNQYKQKRRWAWGIENFPYLAEGLWRNRKISWGTKWTYIFRTLEGHFSWSTAPIIVAGLGWLPVTFGGPAFHATVLSYSLPFITQALMSLAMSGLVISAALSLLLLPPRPRLYGRWRYSLMVLQWVLVPAISIALSALPALESETRLMLGRDLDFNVMEKARRGEQHEEDYQG
jgi:cellulose synthase/poly-beta-1,6-N-acetylglucosamine synthase-like glycosyltransferase